MKLRRVAVENVRSFLERQELQLTGDLSILIGPNGGGKTNLVDATAVALRMFLLKSWIARPNPSPDWPERHDWSANDALGSHLLERHSAGGSLPQAIEVDIEVTKADYDSIVRTKSDAIDIQTQAKKFYGNWPVDSAETWAIDQVHTGAIYTYRIVNGVLETPTSEGALVFQRYLESYEINSQVRSDFERYALSTPMMSLPVNRASGTLRGSVSLAEFNEAELKRNVDAASSRGVASIIDLSIGRLAGRYRLLLENDDGEARRTFMAQEPIAAFTNALEILGYEWELECTNPKKNQYDIRLRKQGSSFRIGAASSGEREILTYLFAIYALNVRDALILVDEPELHLHPRWQRTLLALFDTLAAETGNQFLMATHSPMFVSPSSLSYLSRVYTDNQRSRIVKLAEEDLPRTKHLFRIVSTQNNERMFFADLVVLVEGVSDRIFFEAVFRHLKVGAGTGRVYEVVDVGGKGLFEQYEKLLIACQIRYVTIADLDYVRETGDDRIRGLCATSLKRLKRKVIDDSTSSDGRGLVERLGAAVASGRIDELREYWEYLKERHKSLKDVLSDSERADVDMFVTAQRSRGRCILRLGALEDYLPFANSEKDVEKVIQFVSSDDFWGQMSEVGRQDLTEIVAAIQV